jgi:glycosyltransferase involved in cell wall biosynthesis
MARLPRVTFAARLEGAAGPAAFQRRLARELERRGIPVGFDPADRQAGCILVLGGTRRLGSLARARRAGIPVVQRLNGLNWLHRRRRTGWRHFLRAETNNLLLRYLRDRLATSVIYQSQFALAWWERSAGQTRVRTAVVHNGVPLDDFSPGGTEPPPEDRLRVLVVEANLGGGYEVGLEWARGLAHRLEAVRPRVGRTGSAQLPVEVVVAGRVAENARGSWAPSESVRVRWLGLVSPEQIIAWDRSSHLLFASDLHPACPNSVIEALACGLPVVSFNTGALGELVTGDAGRLAEYGADSWNVDPPDLDGLADAARQVLADQPRFRAGARARALDGLGVEAMADGYLAVMEG